MLPIGHFLLTFLWERLIFRFSDVWGIAWSTPRNQYITDQEEQIMVYVLDKLVAALIIYGLWKLIFAIKDGKISPHVLRLFSKIYFIGLIMELSFFPESFGLEMDNYTNYAFTLRFMPTYWHSIYLGAVYGGCMMALPHPFGIPMVSLCAGYSLYLCKS